MYFKSIKNKPQVFWVKDDFTFFKILETFKDDFTKFKINFYDFKCVGFNYNGLIFKQQNLKSLESGFKLKTTYCYSYGSYALNIFKTLIKTNEIIPTTITENFKIKIRAAYVGGRNEYINEPTINHKIYSVDFNKMYFNCLKMEYLSGKIYYIKTTVINQPGFYYIKYESKHMKYPVLFTKNSINDQNYFCNGVDEGLFWFEEIFLFMEQGGIVHKVYYSYIAENYHNNFLPFVHLIDKQREDKITKFLANNLYGKLAMKDYFYSYKLLNEVNFKSKYENNEIKKWVKWYDFYICENIDFTKYDNYTDICAAAAITSKARIKLYKLIMTLNKSVNICLLNTDEIIFSHESLIKLPEIWDVKIKQISYESFALKKSMFVDKRNCLLSGVSKPFTMHNGMLL